MTLQIQTVESAPFAENSYIVWKDDRTDAVVIDPGFEPDAILGVLRDHGLRLVAVLNTHGHVDHIAGNAAIKESAPEAPLVIGEKDAPMLTDPMLNLSAGFGEMIVSPAADQVVTEGETLHFAGIDWKVLDIPGHSPGHVVFCIDDGEDKKVFGGDVLFRGSIGRTDFPNGDLNLLLTGIREKLWPLRDDTVVYPGHGPVTTVGHEKRTNPFLS